MKYSFKLAALAAAISFVSADQEAATWWPCDTMETTLKTTVKPAPTSEASSINCYESAAEAAITASTAATSEAASSAAYAFTAATSEAASSSTYAAATSKAASSSMYASTANATASATPTGTSTGSYSKASGSKFIIDGETGYFAGTNSYWIGFLTDDADVDLVMEHLQSSGLKVLRVWGFNDVTSTPSSGTVYYQSFAGSEPTINTGADGLQRLDYVVQSAEAHGIKLIINFVNYWTAYGGMTAYFSYAGISSESDWYTSSKAQAQYQKYIQAVVSRYTDSTAVFAWELANEPECQGCDTSVITNWIASTSKYIKSLDSNHMVTIGEEGFGLSTGSDGTSPYGTSAGTDFAANCAVEDIDFCTYHLYPESWGVSPSQSWGNSWITNHGEACAAAGKPCVLEEFGNSDSCTIESSWESTALGATGTGGDMFWQYGDTLSTGETSQDGNTVYYGSSLYTCLVTDHVQAINSAA